MSRHLTVAAMDAFFAGRLSRAELLERTTRHLEELERRAGTRGSGVEAPARTVPADYRRAIRAAAKRAQATVGEIERERETAPELMRLLEETPPADRPLRAMLERRFHTVGLVRHLLAGVRDGLERRETGAESASLSLLHTLVAALDPGRYGPGLVRELAGEVWVLEGMAGLATGDRASAQSAFGAAERLVGSASAGSPVRAGLRLGRARLALARGEMERAYRRLRAAVRWEGEGADGPWKWPARTALAVLLRNGRRPEEAVGFLEGVALPPSGPSEVHAARELVRCLLDAGRSHDAGKVLDRWERTEDPADVARTAALRGLTAAGDREEEVGEVLQGAREELLDRGCGIDAALATARWMEAALVLGSREELVAAVSGLDRFAGCRDLGGQSLADLSRIASRAWRGTLEREDLEAFDLRMSRRSAGTLFPLES